MKSVKYNASLLEPDENEVSKADHGTLKSGQESCCFTRACTSLIATTCMM